MSSLNKVCLIGNLGKDPEVHATRSGTNIVNLTIATSEKWKDKSTGEAKEKTEWHRVVIFNEHLGAIAERYLTKGAKVYIEGKLQTRKWEKDGIERYSTEVVLAAYDGQIVMLGGGERNGEGAAPAARKTTASKTQASAKRTQMEELDDEVPF